jgi:hypothetical protein
MAVTAPSAGATSFQTLTSTTSYLPASFPPNTTLTSGAAFSMLDTSSALGITTSVFLVLGVGGSLTSLVGVVLNLISVVTWVKHGMRPSTIAYLIALSVVDMLLLVSVQLLFCFPALPLPQAFDASYAVVWRTFYPLEQFLQMFSTCLTVCLTIDRYVMVVHPFHAKLWCTTSVSVKMTVASAFLSFFTSLPKVFEFECVKDDVMTGGDAAFPRYNLTLNAMYLDATYRKVYHVILDPIWRFLLPLLVVLSFNFKLIRAFRRRNRMRRGSTRSDPLSDDASASHFLRRVSRCSGDSKASRPGQFDCNESLASTTGAHSLNSDVGAHRLMDLNATRLSVQTAARRVSTHATSVRHPEAPPAGGTLLQRGPMLQGACASDPPRMREAERRLTTITLLVIFLIVIFQTPITIYRFKINLDIGEGAS